MNIEYTTYYNNLGNIIKNDVHITTLNKSNQNVYSKRF